MKEIKSIKQYDEQLTRKLEEKQAQLLEVRGGAKSRMLLSINHLESTFTVTTSKTTIIPSLGGKENGEAVNSGNDAQIQDVLDVLTGQCEKTAKNIAGAYAASLNEQMEKQLQYAYKEKLAVDIQPISDSLDEMKQYLDEAESYITNQEGLKETATLLLPVISEAIAGAKTVRDTTSKNVEDKKVELQLATERVKRQMNQFFGGVKNKLTIRIGFITAEPTLSVDGMPWV